MQKYEGERIQCKHFLAYARYMMDQSPEDTKSQWDFNTTAFQEQCINPWFCKRKFEALVEALKVSKVPRIGDLMPAATSAIATVPTQQQPRGRPSEGRFLSEGEVIMNRKRGRVSSGILPKSARQRIDKK